MSGKTEIDEKLLKALRRAKTSPSVFAFVGKGEKSALLLAKKKVPPTDIAAAKKRVAAIRVVKGKCFGEKGVLVFETPKLPKDLKRSLKETIKKSTGQMMRVVCRAPAVPNGPNSATPNSIAPQSKDARRSSKSKTTPLVDQKAKTSSQPDPSSDDKPPTSPPSKHERAFTILEARLRGRRRHAAGLKPIGTDAFKRQLAAYQQLESELAPLLTSGDYQQALPKLVQIEAALPDLLQADFARRGRKAQQARQEQMQQEMAANFNYVKKVTFAPGSAARLGADKSLDVGKRFKQFLDAMGQHEQQRSDQSLQALENAANAYLERMTELDDAERAKPAFVKKERIVRQALLDARFFGLALQFDQAPTPPWDTATESRLGGLQAAYLFEESGLWSKDGVGGANPLGSEAGVSGAWWVERTEAQLPNDKQGDRLPGKRRYIFKPADREPNFEELPPEGGAMREVASRTISEQLQKMTGLDVGVCPTYLAKIDNQCLPEQDGKPSPNGAPKRVGAMQQLAPADGEIRDQVYQQGPKFVKSIPREEVHKVALLDMLNLNFDRHGGNVLVQKGPPPKTIPIDHGKSLPSRAGFSKGNYQIEKQNFFLQHEAPQVEEPFGRGLWDRVELIDPDELAAQMKATRDELVKQHPEMKDKLGDDSIEMARRSAMFLKKMAKRGRDTPVRVLMRAYMSEMERIFDAAPDKLDAALDEAVANTRRNATAAKDLAGFTQRQLQTIIADLGWMIDDPATLRSAGPRWFEETVQRNPRLLQNIVRGKQRNPLVVRQIQDWVQELGGKSAVPFDPDGMPCVDALRQLKPLVDAHRKQQLTNFRSQAQTLGLDLNAVANLPAGDPQRQKAERLLPDLKEFADAGGDALLGANSGQLTAEQKVARYFEQQFNALNQGNAWDEFVKHYSVNYKPDQWAAKTRALRQWTKMGKQGLEEFKSLGGVHNPNGGVDLELIQLVQLRAQRQASDADPNASLAAEIPSRLAAAKGAIAKISDNNARTDLQTRLAKLQTSLAPLQTSGAWSEVDGQLSEFEADIDAAVRGPASTALTIKAGLADARADLKKISDAKRRQNLKPPAKKAQALFKAHRFEECLTALERLKEQIHFELRLQQAKLDKQALGDQSPLAKLRKDQKAIYDRIQQHSKSKNLYIALSKRHWENEALIQQLRIADAQRELQAFSQGLDSLKPWSDWIANARQAAAKHEAIPGLRTEIDTLINAAEKGRDALDKAVFDQFSSDVDKMLIQADRCVKRFDAFSQRLTGRESPELLLKIKNAKNDLYSGALNRFEPAMDALEKQLPPKR